MTTYHPNGNAEIGDEASSKGERVRASVAQGMADAQDAAADKARDVERAIQTSMDSGMNFVRENPGIALAGAVGFGVLIGLGLGTRR